MDKEKTVSLERSASNNNVQPILQPEGNAITNVLVF